MNAYYTRQPQKEENTMPRPKGSKNKKNRIPVENLDALIAQKQEEKAALEAQRDEIAAVVEAQKNELKAVKADLKKIDKALAGLEAEKAANEAAVAAAAAKEALQSRIDALLSEGKTLDEIMEKLG
jgi:phage shock protein A